MGKVSELKCSNKTANQLAKQYLKKALISLMSQKDFNHISITELVKEANISREAYYNNYSSKNEIIKDIVLEINFTILDSVGRPFTKDVSLDWYLDLFTNVEKYQDTLLTLANAGLQNDYIQIVNDYILSKKDIKNDEIACKRILWNGGIQNLIWQWIKKKTKLTKEKIAMLCYDFFHKNQVYI